MRTSSLLGLFLLTALSTKSRATLTVWRGDFEDEIYRVR